VNDGLAGLVGFDAVLGSDLDVGWDAGWQDEPAAAAFGHNGQGAYDGWTPDREDPRRPTDEEEDQR
jgi:hypothetical protein